MMRFMARTLSLLSTGPNRNQIIVGGISGDILCLVLGDAPMKLNARQIDSAKSREKAYKQSDSAGLYLEVVPSGSRYCRMKYRFNGKEKRMAFGVYPTVTLAQARALRDKAKKKLAEGIDPSTTKK